MNNLKTGLNNNILLFLFFLSVFTLMLNQIPGLNAVGALKYISYFMWITIIFYYLLIKKTDMKVSLIILYFSLIPLYTYSILISQFFNKELFFFRELNLSMLMLLIGSFIYLTSPKLIKYLLLFYVLGVLIVLIDAYLNYLQGNLFTTNTYLYPFKNSLGGMIVNSIIILIYGIKSEKKYLNLLKYFIIIAFFFVLLGIQNRSGIIILGIIMVISIILNSKKIIKYIVLLILPLSIILYSAGDKVIFFINRALLLDSLNSNDINTWSSSRFDSYMFALSEFKENPFFGSKYTLQNEVYIESFYLQYISSYGLVGTIMLLVFLYTLIILIWKSKVRYTDKNLFFLLLFLVFSMFSIAAVEQSAPFGPGAVYFISWILMGYCINIKKVS